ncbi:MAG TPA: hypothetical protein VI547_04945 [Anaerolineales bacterium]|nr:hypothetical protein [Anaerolineales bacterium]
MSHLIVTQVVEKLNRLPNELQQKVLNFVQDLTVSVQRGVSGQQLLKFAGLIALDDLHVMRLAIEAGCEQVDVNGW